MRYSKRDTDVQNSLLDSLGKGEGGMVWENGITTESSILAGKSHGQRKLAGYSPKG